MSKTLVTEWEAWRWCEATGAYERVTHSPVGKPILQPVTAQIRLWFEDDVEHPFYAWDVLSNADAAAAIQVHGLVECERERNTDPFMERVTVIVRDWWTKRIIGKLVNESDNLDVEV